ncbi:tetratricopeptide repeat protein [Oceanimonas baumannii]|uniref:tetratricopeptide repeat protein n=1 Tax=Oceanimonas baumannii TaxID=129578 RepID=UPI003A8D6DE4
MSVRSLTTPLLLMICMHLAPLASASDWQHWQNKATQAYQAGDYQAAEAAIRRALELAEQGGGSTGYTAGSLNLLAFIQADRGELNAALGTMERAVRLGKTALARPGEQLAALYYNQGMLLQQANQPKPALAALQQAMNDYLALNSSGNGKLWQAVTAQGQLLVAEQPEQARTLLLRALSGFDDKPGFTHRPPVPHQARLAYLLGQAHIQLGQYQAAVTDLEQAIELARQAGNAGLQQNGLEYLASAYEQLDQPQQAGSVLEQILALSEQQPASMSRVMQLNELGMQLQQQKLYADAESRFREAQHTLELLNHTQSVEQALVLGNLASVKFAQQEHNAAERLFEQSYRLYLAYPQRPLNAANTAAWLGTLYYNQQDYQKAEPVFLQGLQWLESAPDASPQNLLVALQNLSALYTAWGKKSQARPYARRAGELKSTLK